MDSTTCQLLYDESAPKRITITVGTGVNKSATVFRVARRLPDPLPRGEIAKVARQLGCARGAVDIAIKLRRMLAQHPEPTVEEAVADGKLSTRGAVAIMEEAFGAVRPKRPDYKRQSKRVFQQVDALPQDYTQGMVDRLRKHLGVSPATMRNALQLRRVLRSNPKLASKWRGRALVDDLTPRTILRRIAEAPTTAPPAEPRSNPAT